MGLRHFHSAGLPAQAQRILAGFRQTAAASEISHCKIHGRRCELAMLVVYRPLVGSAVWLRPAPRGVGGHRGLGAACAQRLDPRLTLVHWQ